MRKLHLVQVLKLVDLGAYKRRNCSNEENLEYAKTKNNLPDDIYPFSYENETSFFQISSENFSEAEINMVLNIDKANSLSVIKNCLIFLTTISVIGVVAAAIYIFIALNM